MPRGLPRPGLLPKNDEERKNRNQIRARKREKGHSQRISLLRKKINHRVRKRIISDEAGVPNPTSPVNPRDRKRERKKKLNNGLFLGARPLLFVISAEA
jgi:hypothetical protein